MLFRSNLTELAPADQGAMETRIREQIAARLESDWADLLLVAAAGNESTEMTSSGQSIPASLGAQNILSVGALDDRDTLSGYSNTGKYVDIYIRGTDIRSAVPQPADETAGADDLATTREALTGTSMAAPLVSHLAAEIRLLAPALTAIEVRALILNTGDLKVVHVSQEVRSKRRGTVTSLSPRAPLAELRVVNMARARKIAALIANTTGEDAARLRAKYLVAPYRHGEAPTFEEQAMAAECAAALLPPTGT